MVTSWVKLVSLAKFKPNVPSPLPVLAVMFQVVEGGPLVSVTLVMLAPLTPPACTRLKLLAVKLSTASAKTTCQVTVALLVGLPLARLSETTVVSGRSTRVMVGSLEPPRAVSSVRALEPLVALTVPWVESWVVPSGRDGPLTVARNLMVTLLLAGRLPTTTLTMPPACWGAGRTGAKRALLLPPSAGVIARIAEAREP